MFPLDDSEQQEIRNIVRKLAEKEIPRYQSNEHFGSVPRPLFSALAEIGLAGLAIDESFGGIAASPITTAIVMEELARVDLGPAIFTSVHAMVSGIISRSGNQKQKSDLLPKMASGELLGAFALTEPLAGSDAAALKCTAKRSGDLYLISGEKCYITSAGWADLYVVFAKTAPEKGAQGISAFIVEKNTPGLTISPPEKKMGCELSPIASLNFDSAKVPAANLLGTENDGYRIALSGLAGGRISIAACANGISRAALTAAIKHTGEREQFGQAIREFQGVQFMLADMAMKLQAAQLLTWRAAGLLNDGAAPEQIRISTSMAKCFATDSAMAITTDAVQLLGGAGYIKEYQVERYMRDAKMLQIVEGTNQIQRMVIGRSLAKDGIEI